MSDCPHIVQDYEGTAFCDLAESGINAIGGRLRMAQKENERLRAVIAELLEADSLLATVTSEYYPDANRRWDEAVSTAKAALEAGQVTPSPESDPA